MLRSAVAARAMEDFAKLFQLPPVQPLGEEEDDREQE